MISVLLSFPPPGAVPPSPWASLWRQLASAHWVANVGLPLVVTVAALVVTVAALAFALFRLRTQLKNDRALLGESIRAGQRLTAIQRFYPELVQELERFDTETRQSSFWDAFKWPSDFILRGAIMRAAIVIGDDEGAERLTGTVERISRIWSANIHHARRRGWEKAWQEDRYGLKGTAKPTRDQHIHAMVDTTKALRDELLRTAQLWLSWDGVGPYPLATFPKDTLLPFDGDYRQRFLKETGDEYERSTERVFLRKLHKGLFVIERGSRGRDTNPSLR